ncbi:FecR family protein [Dyadobacter sp. CY323]|uniref:FecR family protein n=1 Tax=Dyadobacter sp. CY323 TaxID=2907302 RepID=UPI001F22AAC2|nr:FecR family protein [Dyadobacter sp. CY323]MCE6989861.1 FecR family protein [Dyadobacter sp. CY323]
MSKDYSKYEIEDFAFDESFQKWVFEEHSGSSGFWEEYIAAHPYQTNKILAARRLVQKLRTDEIPGEPYADLMQEIWDNVQQRIRPKQVTFWTRLSRWQIAASILLIIAAMLGWYKLVRTDGAIDGLPQALVAQGEHQLVAEVNRTNNTLKIYLADGSAVSLARNSRLIYPKKFGSKERIVQLEGEAFFEVFKDADHPFLIYANETVTKVIGTSFRIQAFQANPDVVVSVTTGKVSVFTRKELEQSKTPRGVILTANLQAEFSRSGQQFHKTLVEYPIILPAKKNIQFDFNDTPLNQVFDALQTAYGIEIIYDPDVMAGRTLRVSLDNESMYEKLDVICNTIGMSYQIVDAKVIIEKKPEFIPKPIPNLTLQFMI